MFQEDLITPTFIQNIQFIGTGGTVRNCKFSNCTI
jgi:hypothetical protein